MPPFNWASLAPALLGGLGSLAGGGNQLTPEQQRQYQLQNSVAQQFLEQGRGVPGSSPQERAALAEAHGLLGSQQLSAQGNAYAALSRNSSPGQLADFMGNQISLQTAQRQALDSQAMLASMAQRRNDLLQAAQVSQGAAGTASGPRSQNPLPSLFAGLSQQAGYQAGYGGQPKQPGQPGQTTPMQANDENSDLGKAIQAQQGALGLGQPANVLGGYTSTLNQYRQAGALTGPAAQQFQNPWIHNLFPGGLKLQNGVQY